jgi:hypothetical protein
MVDAGIDQSTFAARGSSLDVKIPQDKYEPIQKGTRERPLYSRHA